MPQNKVLHCLLAPIAKLHNGAKWVQFPPWVIIGSFAGYVIFLLSIYLAIVVLPKYRVSTRRAVFFYTNREFNLYRAGLMIFATGILISSIRIQLVFFGIVEPWSGVDNAMTYAHSLLLYLGLLLLLASLVGTIIGIVRGRFVRASD